MTVAWVAGALALAAGPAARAQSPEPNPRLTAFGSCDELLDFFKRRALRELEERARAPVPTDVVAQPETAPGAAEDFSQTNVQEPGVDEPDIVKTDGRHVFALFNQRLRAVDVRGGPPRLVGTLRLPGPSPTEMLRYGNRLLVFSGGGAVLPLLPEPRGGLITEVDVANPAAMRIVRTLSFDGAYVSSRRHGSTARIVVSAAVRGPQPRPLPPGEQEDPAAAVQRQREAIERSQLADWLPAYTLRDRRSGRSRSGPLVACHQALREPDGSNDDLVAVLTVDLARGLPPVDADGLFVSYADVVYASPGGLYLASAVYRDRDVVQAIHKFDIRRRGQTAYRASGRVPGSLLNQFALSEHAGFLRVATTERVGDRRSQSFVTVLAQRSGLLRRLGRVGNLGRGEAIQAVRFIGDVGFVVTFRRIDPLYTLDLASPSRPRVLGELKIRGYSAYLHPVGRDLVLGVGQDATAAGVQRGTQVSLFDISNLRRPARLANSLLGTGSFSEVEFDHHAFLYWPPARLAVAPVQFSSRDGDREARRGGVVGFRVGRGVGVRRVGLVTHGAGSAWSPVRRSLVVGGRLVTVSERGVETSSLATLSQQGFARFPLAPPTATPR